MFKATGDPFYFELYAAIGIFTKNILYLREIIFERVIFGRIAL